MLPVLVLSLVTAERVFELWLARRNTRVLLAQGAYEVAPEHYKIIVLLHAAWLAGLWLLGPHAHILMGWLILFALLQVMRVWILATLGARWTTRIIVLPDAPLATTGPYRFLRHPNYAVVIGEIAALPLAFGLPAFAAVFTLLNLGILAVRVRAENAVLVPAR